MKIIEAMNSLKLVEKKLGSKVHFIGRYAARPDFEDDRFAGDERKRVEHEVQAAEDLIVQYESLKRSLDYTNLMQTVKVNIGGAEREFSIHSLIQHKRTLCKLKKRVYSALDDRGAQSEIEALRRQKPDSLKAQVIRNFDIDARDKNLGEIDELESAIDSALQIANAQLDLMEPPSVNGNGQK